MLGGHSVSEAQTFRIINGFVIGAQDGPAQALVVGVGDSTKELVARNVFLSALGINVEARLNLPIMAKLDVSYNDGHVQFKLGCAMGAGLDGNDRFAGVAYAGFDLCPSNPNDWSKASHQAYQLIKRFQHDNPAAKDVSRWAAAVSREEWVELAGDTDIPREFFSEQKANSHWAALAASGHPRNSQQDHFIDTGLFRLKNTLILFTISKEPISIDDIGSQGNQAMSYRVGMAFLLLKGTTHSKQ